MEKEITKESKKNATKEEKMIAQIIQNILAILFEGLFVWIGWKMLVPIFELKPLLFKEAIMVAIAMNFLASPITYSINLVLKNHK